MTIFRNLETVWSLSRQPSVRTRFACLRILRTSLCEANPVSLYKKNISPIARYFFVLALQLSCLFSPLEKTKKRGIFPRFSFLFNFATWKIVFLAVLAFFISSSPSIVLLVGCLPIHYIYKCDLRIIFNSHLFYNYRTVVDYIGLKKFDIRSNTILSFYI